MGKERMSSKPSEFIDDMRRIDEYMATVVVPTIPVRLGLAATVAGEWHTRYGVGQILYNLFNDETTRTKTVGKKMLKYISDTKLFTLPILNIVAASPNATEDDAAKFNVVLNRASPSHHDTQITDSIIISHIYLGGGDTKFGAKTLTHSKRSALAEFANGIECAYFIGVEEPKDPTILQSIVSSKAIFIVKGGIVNKGLNLYTFFRWVNTSNPKINSAWTACMVFQVVV